MKWLQTIREHDDIVLIDITNKIAFFDSGNSNLIMETGDKFLSHEYIKHDIFKNNFTKKKKTVKLKESRFLI